MSRRRFLASSAGMATAFLAMNEVYGQFFDVDPRAARPGARPGQRSAEDLFVFDDQLHMVRETMNGPHVFLAFVAGRGRCGGPRLQEEPVPARRPGRRARPAWAALEPGAGAGPINSGAHFSRCSSRTSTSTARSRSGPAQRRHARRLRPPGGPKAAPRAAYTESQQVVNLTARQTAAIRNFVNRISGSQRMLAHGQLYPGRAEPRVHGAADPGEPSRLVEGLQHRVRRQGRRRSEQPDAALAARRREGRLPDLRADRAPQGAAREAPGLLQHLHPQGLLALARRHARDGQPDRHPEGGARLAAVQLHHLPRLLGRHGAVRLVAPGARRHPRRAQLPATACRTCRG